MAKAAGKKYGIFFWLLSLFAACFGIAIIAIAAFAGFFVGERDIFPSEFFTRVEGKLQRTIMPRGPAKPLKAKTFSTHLLLIDADGGSIAVGAPDNAHPLTENGGGMTSFGGDVLLLPYDGRIYAATSSDDIRATEITAPDNNREAYHALADDPEFADFDVKKGYLRYNDIAAFDTGVEQGLLASYTEFHQEDTCATNTVAKLVIDGTVTSIGEVNTSRDDWEIIYRSEPCLKFKTKFFALEGHMAGGRLVMKDQLTVLLANGDFHMDGMRSEPKPGPLAQNPRAHYGKVVAIDLETNETRIVTMGHRNPQGLDVLSNGTVVLAEHGPRGGDEVNVIREGPETESPTNYGWPVESFGTTYYGSAQLPNSISFGRHDAFVPPMYSWVPSIATSSLTGVNGFNELWDGDILVASLIDRSLHRLRLVGDRVVYSERIPIGSRIRDVHQHSDGRIVLWTDNQELIFLTARERENVEELFARYVDKSNISSNLAERTREAVEGCAECHSFEAGDHKKAPSLATIFGDPIGATPFQGYSDALAKHGGEWTEQNLTKFIQNPNAFASGTYMPAANIESVKVIESLVHFLEQMDNTF